MADDNPLFHPFQKVHDCLKRHEGLTMAQCVSEAVTSSRGIAADVCRLVDGVTAASTANMSPTADVCRVVRTKEDKASLKKLIHDCETIGQPLDAVTDLLHRCKHAGHATTEWGVVLGLAIPLGVLGLIVLLSCVYALVRLMRRT